MYKNSFIGAAVIVVLSAMLPLHAFAFTFTKDSLITDLEMENASLLTADGIQRFLEEKGSILATTTAQDIDGQTKRVADIIESVSIKYNLSPMLFLVMAQKESSAITSTTLTYPIEHWILGFGRCDSCTEEQAAPYRGIANQFNSAASRIRDGYLADLADHGYTISGWGPGRTKTTLDGIEVTPENDATAALYTYNPWVGAYGGGDSRWGANSLFQKLWQEWNPGVKYPNGTLIQIGQVVYLIQDGKKRAFTSKSALIANYDLRKIIIVSSVAGEMYKTGANIQFPNYTLLRNPAGTVYLLVNGKKRGFTSQKVMYAMGYNPEQILDAGWDEIKDIPEGKPFTAKTAYPQGALLQDRETSAVFYIDPRGKKHPIWSPVILRNRFPNQSVSVVDHELLAQFTQAQPVGFVDGTLLTSTKSGAVYVIANGKRRPFASGESFAKYGYQWENVITVSDTLLKIHKKGRTMP